MSISKTGSKVAIVTGGASGIGLAFAQELARSGVHVVLADRQIDLARREAGAIAAGGGSAAAAELDVRNAASFQELVQATLAAAGRLDYLFNNAGIGVAGEMRHFTARDWSDVLDVNVLGVANGVSAAYPIMIRQGSGHIINTASLAGLLAVPLVGSYTASKFAVVGLSRALRAEARRYGVRVSVVCPGLVRTPIMRGGAYGRLNADAAPLAERAGALERLAMDPSVFARRALRRVARNRGVIVLPWWARVVWHVDRTAPSMTDALTRWLLARALRPSTHADPAPSSGLRADTDK